MFLMFLTFAKHQNNMKLPCCDNLVVDSGKIVGYLLNLQHPQGRSKARFFMEFGFSVEQWEQLAEALHDHGCRNEIDMVYETGFGPRYTVEGELYTPDGRCPRVRSVWQMDKGAVAPRLITAYPVETKL